jgi:hypothetical protein
MTIGWAIIVVAILYLLDKYLLLKKALVVSAIILALGAVGYCSFIGWVLVKEKWDSRAGPKVGDPIPPGATIGDPLSYKVGEALDIGKGSVPQTFFIPGPQPSSPAPGDGEWLPIPSGNEFSFRRLGSKQYLKAICYNETTESSASPIHFDDETKAAICAPPSILMEEVK